MGDEEEEVPKYKLFVLGQDKPREEGSQKFLGEGKALYLTKEGALGGDTYEGSFVEGIRRGKGVYTFSKNGDVYSGHYEENQKHGFGKITYTSKTGLEEEGEEADPLSTRGGTYLGHFAAGQRGSQTTESSAPSDGTFRYANGDIYVGQWLAGKKSGNGTYSYAKDGTKLVGEWANGKITSGQWVFPNGTYYSGTFRYNKPYGKGVWIFGNGNQLTGEYLHKEQPGEDGGGDEDEGAPKPDPKVWCKFKCGQNVAVRGGTMFQPKWMEKVAGA